MKNRTVGSFIAGVFVGTLLVASAVAATVPYWRKTDVKPVVLLEYHQLYGFQPIGSDSPLAPSWPKDKVTPVVFVKIRPNILAFCPTQL